MPSAPAAPSTPSAPPGSTTAPSVPPAPAAPGPANGDDPAATAGSSGGGSAASGSSGGAAVGAEVLWAPLWVNSLVATAGLAQPRPAASVARCAAIEAVASTPLSQLADAEAPHAELLRRYTAALDNCQPPQGGGSVLPTTSR